jgi:hypothetical protein
MRKTATAVLCTLPLLAMAQGAPAPGAEPRGGPRAAQQRTSLSAPTGGEWRRSCEAYMQALQGTAKGEDMEVTYCLGLTLGLVEGMRLGSQLGALNFGSQLAVAHQLDPGAVFAQFQRRSAASLLQVCPPEGVGLRGYVTAVHAWLGNHTAALERPVTEVFFEALQAAFPCGDNQ